MGQQIINFWETHSAVIFTLAKNIAITVIVIAVCIALSKGLQKLINKSSFKNSPVDGTVKPLLQAIVRYGILIICFIMILNVFGVNTASLLAVLGAAGIAVGLALKDTLGNIASGIILLVMGSIRAGEFIEFSSYKGTVKEINLFTTILETPDGIYISAPNSAIWGNPFLNYTRNGKRRMELSIGISYSDSVDDGFKVMHEILAGESRFLKDPAPQVILQSIEENSIKITLRAWASVQNYWDIYWDMNKTIKVKIEEAGLHIPLPQRKVQIIKD